MISRERCLKLVDNFRVLTLTRVVVPFERSWTNTSSPAPSPGTKLFAELSNAT
jgi:hypothetical protein